MNDSTAQGWQMRINELIHDKYRRNLSAAEYTRKLKRPQGFSGNDFNTFYKTFAILDVLPTF